MFSTKRYYAGFGLYDFGYRFYSPSLGRWINRDPMGEDGGLNLYGAMGNNAVNMADPWGLSTAFDTYVNIGNSSGEHTYSGDGWYADVTSGSSSDWSLGSMGRWAYNDFMGSLNVNFFSNEAQGFGDAVTGGATREINNQWIKNVWGGGKTADANSPGYNVGYALGSVWSLGMAAEGSVVATSRLSISAIGEAAVSNPTTKSWLIKTAEWSSANAKTNKLAHLINNNCYIRVGLSRWPGVQGKVPRLAVGTDHKKWHWRLK